jgi:lipoate-protein ligase B
VPCGIADAGVTSLARLGLAVGLEKVEGLMVDALERVLEGRARTMSPAGPLALVPVRRSAGAAP